MRRSSSANVNKRNTNESKTRFHFPTTFNGWQTELLNVLPDRSGDWKLKARGGAAEVVVTAVEAVETVEEGSDGMEETRDGCTRTC
jgi:hypothetical protein